MGMPTDIGIIDTMIDFPHPDMKETYRFITRQTRDAESKESFEFPVEYMFKDVPEKEMRDVADPVALTLGEMDRWGIERGMIGVGHKGGRGRRPWPSTPTGSSPRPMPTPTRAWRRSGSSAG